MYIHTYIYIYIYELSTYPVSLGCFADCGRALAVDTRQTLHRLYIIYNIYMCIYIYRANLIASI